MIDTLLIILFTSIKGEKTCLTLTIHNPYTHPQIQHTHLRYPQGTHNMCPSGVICLFEGSAFVGAEGAIHSSGGRLQAAAAQPLAFGDVRYPVTLLMYSQVTHVTEQDNVTVLALAVIADAAHSVLINQGVGISLLWTKTE